MKMFIQDHYSPIQTGFKDLTAASTINQKPNTCNLLKLLFYYVIVSIGLENSLFCANLVLK